MKHDIHSSSTDDATPALRRPINNSDGTANGSAFDTDSKTNRHDTLNKLTDPELAHMITTAQGILQARAEKRKSDAMEQIRQIAAAAQIAVTFDAGRKPKGAKAVLRAGDRFVNPADASQSYIVGKGKPPHWFASLRDKNRLPSPASALEPALKEQ
jgi:hypothetical protein